MFQPDMPPYWGPEAQFDAPIKTKIPVIQFTMLKRCCQQYAMVNHDGAA